MKTITLNCEELALLMAGFVTFGMNLDEKKAIIAMNGLVPLMRERAKAIINDQELFREVSSAANGELDLNAAMRAASGKL